MHFHPKYDFAHIEQESVAAEIFQISDSQFFRLSRTPTDWDF
jgi:hypothetical protein